MRLLHFRIFQRLKIEISSSMLDSKRKHYPHTQHDSEEVLKSVKHNAIRRSLKLLAFAGVCVYFLLAQLLYVM